MVDVKKFVHFIGVVRTGHTLISSLLDAHPNFAISVKASPFTKFIENKSRKKIFQIIIKNALFNEFRKLGGYSYKIDEKPRSENISIIGDSGIPLKTMIKLGDKQILSIFSKFIKVPIYWVWVIRNPFESISSACKMNRRPISYMIEKYYEVYQITHKFYKENRSQCHLIYIEDLIKDPHINLSKLFDFFEVTYDEEFLNLCSEKIFDKPHKVFDEEMWSNKDISLINRLTIQIPELRRYHNEF